MRSRDRRGRYAGTPRIPGCPITSCPADDPTSWVTARPSRFDPDPTAASGPAARVPRETGRHPDRNPPEWRHQVDSNATRDQPDETTGKVGPLSSGESRSKHTRRGDPAFSPGRTGPSRGGHAMEKGPEPQDWVERATEEHGYAHGGATEGSRTTNARPRPLSSGPSCWPLPPGSPRCPTPAGGFAAPPDDCLQDSRSQ